eukprot:14987516-Alexandrium_andersonii.AAC.1
MRQPALVPPGHHGQVERWRAHPRRAAKPNREAHPSQAAPLGSWPRAARKNRGPNEPITQGAGPHALPRAPPSRR